MDRCVGGSWGVRVVSTCAGGTETGKNRPYLFHDAFLITKGRDIHLGQMFDFQSLETFDGDAVLLPRGKTTVAYVNVRSVLVLVGWHGFFGRFDQIDHEALLVLQETERSQ
eukprot:CAMPEP_0194366738 /NCGR_PEP_ID=MMETSP0174-20130528/14808_1 /TAXON_ID=216777 /ORGANISM="Proboscia alata, Strain PI-D3" /LENGTH=110 /DNA_ID=CAMNT_0039142107 /DNA_START=934 /DNA_END=1264 /DNA_ORIENTATION=+